MICTILQNPMSQLARSGAAVDERSMDKTAELAEIVARHTKEPGISATTLPRLSLIRADRPSVPTPAVYEASLCLIVQGSKHVSLGEHSLLYDSARYLLVSVDLPLVGHVIEASPDRPYLCCKVDIDLPAVADLLVTHGGRVSRGHVPALAIQPIDPELVDAVCRLVRLLDRPDDIDALSPLIEREILYRLLTGPLGAMLRHVATSGNPLNQVSRAIAAIRKRYDQQLRIEEIAAEAGMSPSSLHAHFKAVTRMTPIEYQKQLRLQEARRLMMAAGASASTAGFAVGYGSPSQFSREYRRLFGAPPREDIGRLQTAPEQRMAL